jgi:hypothetical protein
MRGVRERYIEIFTTESRHVEAVTRLTIGLKLYRKCLGLTRTRLSYKSTKSIRAVCEARAGVSTTERHRGGTLRV